MARRRDRAELVVLLAIEVAAVVTLHRLGSVDGLRVPWSALGDWARTAPPEEVVGAVVRAIALALSWWLLVSTLLCIVATGVGRAPGAARVLTATALPSVRRLVQRAVAASVVAGAAVGVRPALAAPPPTTSPDSAPVVAIDHRGPRPNPSTTAPSGRSGRTGGLESLPAPPAPSTPAPLPDSPGAEAAGVPATPLPPAIGAGYVVAEGDSLWTIAATQLARLTGRAPADVPDVEVAPYWVAVVAANRDRLRSGDPNLIYPFEELDLPPVA